MSTAPSEIPSPSAAHAWVRRIVASGVNGRPSYGFTVAHHICLVAGLIAVIVDTEPAISAAHQPTIAAVFAVVALFFAVEYAARLVIAADGAEDPPDVWPMRLRYLRSPMGLVDLVAAVPIVLLLPAADGVTWLRMIGVLWILKLFRYSPGWGILGRVFRQARGPLITVFLAFLVVLLLAATLGYIVEGDAQPKAFGSLPDALWWTITTLTTTGYGDEVPVTAVGRLLGSAVMICGIAVFALWAGILSNAFASEIRRRDFLRNWDMIVKVPAFHDLGPSTVAEIARLLRAREVRAGTAIVRRGEAGDCMYFIADGEVEVQVKPKPIHFGPGEFFGEIALITGKTRRATAVATRATQLLVLDVADFRGLASHRPELATLLHEEGHRRIEESDARRAAGRAALRAAKSAKDSEG